MSRTDFSAKNKLKSARTRKNAYQGRSKEDSGTVSCRLSRGFSALLRGGLISFLVICLSIALLAGYRWVTTSTYFNLQEIQIKGNVQLSEQDIMDRAELKQGNNCLALNMSRIKARLLQEPWVKNVLVRRVLPDKLVIKLNEHQPAYWLQKNDRLYYAESQGNIIAPVLPEGFVSLPLLSIKKNREIQMQGLEVIHEWTVQRKLPFSMAEVAWVHFITDDILEFYLRDQGMALRLGTGQLEKNFQYLNRVWTDLAGREELGEVDRILVYEQKAWVRMA